MRQKKVNIGSNVVEMIVVCSSRGCFLGSLNSGGFLLASSLKKLAFLKYKLHFRCGISKNQLVMTRALRLKWL